MESSSANLSGVTVSKATEKDIRWIKVHQREFGHELGFEGTEFLENFAIKHDRKIVGIARIFIKGKYARLTDFSIIKGSRRKGFGKKAIKLLDKKLARRGVLKSDLYSALSARSFWKRTKYRNEKTGMFTRNPSKNKKRSTTAPQNIMQKDSMLKRRKR